MATEIQSNYIADLAVKKTKEFKEVKELLLASDIVGDRAEIVKSAETLAEITHALTDLQASKFIDLLIAHKEPVRDKVYAKRRVERTVATLDDIKSTIAGWDFDGLR